VHFIAPKISQHWLAGQTAPTFPTKKKEVKMVASSVLAQRRTPNSSDAMMRDL
jgi:hypothetical protein